VQHPSGGAALWRPLQVSDGLPCAGGLQLDAERDRARHQRQQRGIGSGHLLLELRLRRSGWGEAGGVGRVGHIDGPLGRVGAVLCIALAR